MSWRRAAVLVRQLPADSRTVRALGGPSFTWGQDTYLLAMLVDLLAAANWQRGGNKNAPRPKPLPRPGDRSTSDTVGKAVPLSELRRRLHPEDFDDGG